LSVFIIALLLSFLTSSQASAAPTLVRQGSNFAVTNNLNITLTGATTDNLLVIICSSGANSTFSTPSGFQTAINQSGIPSQAIFYKIATGGETSYTCTFSANTNSAMQVYEYSGIYRTPMVLTGSATGNSTSPSSGSTTTAYPNALLLASFILNTGSSFTGWSNSFSQLVLNGVTNGNPGGRYMFGGADLKVTVAGTYSTVASGSTASDWRGQIASFKAIPTNPQLGLGFVDGSGASIPPPTISLPTQTTGFNCQASNGTLGTSSQRIRVTNTTNTPAWSLGIAATNGVSSTWSDGSSTYTYNNPANAGCTSGQLSINAASGTITPTAGCTNTGVSLGSNSAYSSGVVNSITLASASGLAAVDCVWDITDIPLIQQIPAEQSPGTYSLPLTLTVVAN